MKVVHVSGKRKQAIARATLRLGNGIVRINSKLLQFWEPSFYRTKIEEPLIIAGEAAKHFDIDVNVKGGGINSQAEAARQAVAKALSVVDKSLQQAFLSYDRALLVSDIRKKEERKPNRHGKARAKVQKSYR
ncbi:MAG: 30S ribosomal protein S9 [Candidatus Woesearchaeota archaeon]